MSICLSPRMIYFFFFNDTATTEIYTLSLHDALPISSPRVSGEKREILCCPSPRVSGERVAEGRVRDARSEEHTSELQSRLHLVCRLLLEKKKKKTPECYRSAELEARRNETYIYLELY